MSETGEDLGVRKARHLEICIANDHYAVEGGTTGFEGLRFLHRSIPDLDAEHVSTATEFLGIPVRAPLLISSMTGGSAEAYRANQDLARAAELMGLPVGMGSIRILFRKPEVFEHFQLKKLAPSVPVMANIGAVQLRDGDDGQLIELIKRLEVDGLAIHLNPGQELFQHDGDRDFRNVLASIARFAGQSPVPVIVKETGCGIAPSDMKRLFESGAAYVNVAGSGGTNWMSVEKYRLDQDDPLYSDSFTDWGNPTAITLSAARHILPSDIMSRVIASGGLRTGVDLAKAIALGASLGGFALPLIRAVARGGVEAVQMTLEQILTEFRTAMVLAGAENLEALRRCRLLETMAFRHEVGEMIQADAPGTDQT